MNHPVKKVLKSNQSIKYKLEYLWGYYWAGLLVGLGLLIVLIFFATQVLTKKDSQLSVGIYTDHANYEATEQLKTTLTKWTPLNSNNQEVQLIWNDITKQNTTAKLFATVNDHSVDLLITKKPFFNQVQKDIGCQKIEASKKFLNNNTGIYRNSQRQIIGIRAARIRRLKQFGLNDEIIYIPQKSPHKQNAEKILKKLINESVD